MSGKKWCVLWMILYAVIILLIGSVVIIVDPYFHFHGPIEGVSYSLENVFYINDGVSKNFNYNAMITGTSLTRDFRTEEAGQLFDKDFVRITYHGEGFKRIADNLKGALEVNQDLETVIWGIDPLWFISDAEWQGYEEYSDYLFDDVLWNDVNYLYNKDMVLENYQRSPKSEGPVKQEETDEFFEMLKANLEKNILPPIKENPDVEFYIFFPPYSICWWDSINQTGEGHWNEELI